MMPLLAPGESEIMVYADASQYVDVALGSWAFRVPSFHLSRTGIEYGEHVEQFELAGVVSAIEAVVAVDFSTRRVHVLTDSDFVITVFRYVIESKELPPRKSYKRVAHLTERAITALKSRSAICSDGRGTPDHQRCHVEALAAVKNYVAGDLRIRAELAIRREERRIAQLLAERTEVERSSQRIDVALALSETRLDALREHWRRELSLIPNTP